MSTIYIPKRPFYLPIYLVEQLVTLSPILGITNSIG